MTTPRPFHHRLRRWLDAPAELRLVCEMAADYVAAVRYHRGRIEAWATRTLPEGAVRPAPLGDNVVNAPAVQEALEHVVGSVGEGQRRVALLVPDLLARVVVLEFDQLPAGAEEADALIRWRLSKDLPFDVRQAALSYQRQPGRNGGQEALVAACPRASLRQYEECLEKVGLQPGWVTLSTLAALGGLESSPPTARLLVKRDHSSLSLAIVHGDAVRLFRNLPTGGTPLGAAALLEKIYPAMVYFQDQWGQKVSELVLAGAGQASPTLTQQLEREIGCPAKELGPAALDLPPSPASGAPPDYRLLSSLGWVRGERE